MEPTTAAVFGGAAGLLIGFLVWAALGLSDRERSVPEPEHEIPPGVTDVLAVLRSSGLVVDHDGRVVRIVAAAEATYRVACPTPRDLLRCAFHLGNRHTQAQVGDGFLRIRQDSVLKEMLEGLGATVTAEDAPFEPESGAYGGGHGHHHGDEGGHHPLAPIPLRQRIHRPTDKA